jgi:hypothetical protein
MKTLKIKFDFETPFKYGIQCDTCGEMTYDLVVVAERADENAVIVCGECLKHPERIDAQLAEHAKRIEEGVAADVEDLKARAAQAANLRSCIGRLKLPTYAQWMAKLRQDDDEFTVSQGIHPDADPDDKLEYAELKKRLAATAKGTRLIAKLEAKFARNT